MLAVTSCISEKVRFLGYVFTIQKFTTPLLSACRNALLPALECYAAVGPITHNVTMRPQRAVFLPYAAMAEASRTDGASTRRLPDRAVGSYN